MTEINKVQLEIFKAFLEVCEKLKLTYYMAHGSLLGAIRYEGFFPYDDDIDIIMPRKDFELLLEEGQKYMSSRYFIQACKTERDYPLAFAKIRDTETAFIQPAMKNFNVNQGIYIDIFPLDYYPKNPILQKTYGFKEKLLSTRINKRMNFQTHQPFTKRFLRAISVLFSPSWENAVQKRANLYAHVKESPLVITSGGKGKEKGMPSIWFGNGKQKEFEHISVKCPDMMEEYLTRIYGDYMSFNPAAKYMDDQNRVEVSASVYSTKESYKTIVKRDIEC